jgi:hypothetical protein
MRDATIAPIEVPTSSTNSTFFSSKYFKTQICTNPLDAPHQSASEYSFFHIKNEIKKVLLYNFTFKISFVNKIYFIQTKILLSSASIFSKKLSHFQPFTVKT